MSSVNVYFVNSYTHNGYYSQTEKNLILNKINFDTELVKNGPCIDDDDIESDYDSDREFGCVNQNARTPKHNSKTGRRHIISVRGVLEDSSKIVIHFIGCISTFSVRIPEHEDRERFKEKLIYKIKNSMYSNTRLKHGIGKCFDSAIFEERKIFHGFRNGKQDRFLTFRFRNTNTRKQWKYAIEKLHYNGSMIFKKNTNHLPNIDIYEYADDYNMRFFTELNISSIGWHTVDNYVNMSPMSKKTTTEYEIVVDVNKLNISIDSEHDPDVILTRFAFDIEVAPLKTRLKRYKSAFDLNLLNGSPKTQDEIMSILSLIEIHPMLENDDPVLQIGISILTGPLIAESTSYENIILSLHPIEETYPSSFGTYMGFDNEADLLVKFIELFKKCNPDIMLTYNGDTYDWKYIMNRCKKYNIYNPLLKMSTFSNFKSNWNSRSVYTKMMGTREISIPRIPLCFNLDLLNYYMKQNNINKYPSLKLGLVAEKVLGETKEDLPYTEMYKLAEVVFGHEYNYPLSRELPISESRELLDRISSYCIQDCVLLHKLNYANSILLTETVKAKINNVSIWYSNTRGVSTKCLITISNMARKKGYILKSISRNNDQTTLELFTEHCEVEPDLKKKYDSILRGKPEENPEKSKSLTKRAKDKFIRDWFDGYTQKGGHVFLPTPGLKFNVACLDVKSEYPSVIRSHNLSPEMLVLDPQYLNLPGIVYETIIWKRKNGLRETATFVCDRFNRTPENKGILPEAVEHFLNARNEVKRQMQGLDRTSDAWKLLNSKQLNLKVFCNSVYGVTNYKYSPICCKPIAGSITQKAREYIKMCSREVDDKFGLKTVYGDTDSIFVQHPDMTSSTEENFYNLWDLAKQGEEHLNNLTAKAGIPMMQMELEKVYTKLFMTDKKKRYNGIMCIKRDYNAGFQKTMGFAYIKRDAPKIQKVMGKHVAKLSLKNDFIGVVKYIEGEIDKIFNGLYDYTWFVKGNKYKPETEYVNPSNSQVCRAVRIIKKYNPGVVPAINDRVYYTYRYAEPIIGPRGGIRYPKKVDQVWPKLLIDTGVTPNIKIDYRTFITYVLNSSETELILGLQLMGSKLSVSQYFKNFMDQYKKI